MEPEDWFCSRRRTARSAFNQDTEEMQTTRRRGDIQQPEDTHMDSLVQCGFSEDKQGAATCVHIIRRAGHITTGAEELSILDDCRRRHDKGR